MATPAIDLSAGLVPAPSQDIDMSAGLVPAGGPQVTTSNTISAAPPSALSPGDTGQFLSNRAAQLNQEAQRQMYMANGPEAEGRSLVNRGGHAVLSLLPATAAKVDQALAALTDWKNAAATAAGAVDPAIPAAYFGTQGVAGLTGLNGQPSSIKQAIQQPTPENVDRALTDASMAAGAASGAEAPGAGAALEKAKMRGVRTELPESRITKLIKPSASDLKYGADPVRAITREDIVGNNLDDIGQKVYARARDVGKTIDAVLASPENAAKQIDISKAVNGPIQEAEATAVRQGNRALYTRLEDLKKQVNNEWQETVNKNGDKELTVKGPRRMVVSPEEATQIKRDVADMTRWSGLDPMENDLNATKAAIFARIKESVNQAVPQVTELNQRYADLVGAGKAIERRAPVESRNASFSLGDIALGGAGVLAGSSPAGAALTVAHKVARSPGVVTRAMSAIYPSDLKYESPAAIRARLRTESPPEPEPPKGSPGGGKPPQPERRGGNGGGGPRATVFTDADRAQIRERLAAAERGTHPNHALSENPFDRDPSNVKTLDRDPLMPSYPGAEAVLSKAPRTLDRSGSGGLNYTAKELEEFKRKHNIR